MKKRIIGYVLVFVFSMYLFFMYYGEIWTVLIILELLYPLISFGFLLRLSRQVSVSMESVPAMGECGKKLRAQILLKNHSRFQSVKYCLTLYIRHPLTQKRSCQKIKGILPPASTERITQPLDFQYSGSYEITSEDVKLYDILSIFYHKIPLTAKQTVGILPPFEMIPIEITRRTRDFPADADVYSSEKQGDDSSEIYQIREYRPQDPIHFVHWKLTAKEGELMVKEHGFPLGCVVLIWVRIPAEQTDILHFHRLLEQTASISISLFSEKCIHMITWFDEKNQHFVKWKINTEEAVYDCIWHLLYASVCHDVVLEESCYEQEFRPEHFSSIITLNGDGTMIVNGEPQTLLQV